MNEIPKFMCILPYYGIFNRLNSSGVNKIISSNVYRTLTVATLSHIRRISLVVSKSLPRLQHFGRLQVQLLASHDYSHNYYSSH